MTIGLAVPVLNNFKGYTELMASVDQPIMPFVQRNWDHNIGVGPAWNNALRWAINTDIEFLFVVNDDVVFRPGVMHSMLHWSKRKYDLVSPQNETGVCHPYGLNFWCFLVQPKEFVERFGFFDENFAPAYYEDDDMAYRMHLLGGNIKTTHDKIYHAVSGSETDPDLTRSLYDKNLAYYIEKWGGPPNGERYRTPYNGKRSPLYWRNNAG